MATSDVVARVKAWFSGLPLFTKAVFTACVASFVLELFIGDVSGRLCMSAERTFARLQLYRAVTSSFVHMGILHLVFNMLAFVSMGQQLEKAIGTVPFGYLVALFTVLGAAVYGLAVQLLYYSGIYPGAARECAIGLSGTIFGLIVVTVALSRAANQSIFGLFEIPSKLYPWALLAFWQLLVPNVSFVGHLAGVCVGQAWVLGWLKRLELPRPWVHRIEAALSPCHSLGGFAHSSQLPTTAPATAHALPSSRDRPPPAPAGADWLERISSSEAAAFVGIGKKTGTKLTHAGAAPLSEPFHLAARPAAAEADPEARRAAIAAAAEARLQGAGARAPGLPSEGSKSDVPQQGAAAHALSVAHVRAAVASEAASRPADDQARAAPAASSSQTIPGGADARSFQDGMLKLQEMGFQPTIAYAALTTTGGDVDAALERLLQQS